MNNLDLLWDVLRDRKLNPKKGSYSSSLFLDKKGAVNKIAEKIGEETTEFILACKDDKNVVEECADLIFFITAMLAEKNVSWIKVMDELKRRN